MRVLQLLNWKLNSIESILDEVKRQGFDAIQINPMQKFKESENGYHWWLSYQPLGFDLGNQFGTKEDLTSLCQSAKEKGIDIIVDVVLNHVANQNPEDCMTPSSSVDPEILAHPEVFKEKLGIDDYGSREQCVTRNICLPGLHLNNPIIQKKIFNYLEDLKNCGVKGLRLDAVKHVGLPNDGVMFAQYLQTFLKANGMFAYGEFLGRDVPWMNEASQYYDILNHCSCGFQNKDKFFPFVESHDTFLNSWGHTKNVPTDEIARWYRQKLIEYRNGLYYVRAIKGPYNDELSPAYGFDRPFNEIDEFDYFDTSFIDNVDIRVANERAHYSERKLKLSR